MQRVTAKACGARHYRVRRRYRWRPRGWVIATAAGLALLIAAATLGAAGGGNRARADDGTALGHRGTVTEVVVERGDTLWSIASRHAKPGEDIRYKVHEIMKANGLKDAQLRAGMVIVIPEGKP